MKNCNKILVLFLLCLTLLHSATVNGQIIDGDTLEKMDNVLVTVDTLNGTTLAQKFFDKEYAIEVPLGTYIVRAYYYENGSLTQYAEYKFQIAKETTEFDLVLIPYELQAMTPDFVPPPLLNKPGGGNSGLQIDLGMLASAVMLIIILYLIYTRFILQAPKGTGNRRPARRSEEEKPRQLPKLDEDCKRVVGILEENECRMLQKELRDILHFSETKMSLVISELEAVGLVRRIKKGRENILKLTK